MRSENLAFLLLVILAIGFFAHNVQRLVGYLRIGLAENRLDHPAVRARNVLLIGIAQTKILRDPLAGAMHASVFWGFVVLTAGTVEVILQGIRPGFSFAFLPRPLYAGFLASQDLFGVLVLGAVSWLLYRRLVIKPKRLQGDQIHHGDAIFILSMIAALMITMFLAHGFEFALHPSAAHREQPVSYALGLAFAPLGAGTASVGRNVFWWSHAVLILFFLNYLPYSKHLHVLTSLINVFFSNTSGPGTKGAMRPMDLEAEGVEQFGAADVGQLSWKNLLDGYSCTECGRCTAACPAPNGNPC